MVICVVTVEENKNTKVRSEFNRSGLFGFELCVCASFRDLFLIYTLVVLLPTEIRLLLEVD